MSLQRSLEIGSYQTAWAMLHRLRSVLVRPGRERLSGEVEVDESFFGGEEPGLRGGRARGKKTLVGIAIERARPKGFVLGATLFDRLRATPPDRADRAPSWALDASSKTLMAPDSAGAPLINGLQDHPCASLEVPVADRWADTSRDRDGPARSLSQQRQRTG